MMNMRYVPLVILLSVMGCGGDSGSILKDEGGETEAGDGSNTETPTDPMFDPLPEGLDPQTDSPWVPISFESDNPQVCVEGCESKINWNSPGGKSDGRSLPIAGPSTSYIRNENPLSQNLTTIFDRYGPHWVLEGVFGLQNGPQIPQSVPPSMVDIDIPMPPVVTPPPIEIPADPAAGMLAAFADGSRWAYEMSVKLAEQAKKDFAELRNRVEASNSDLASKIKAQIEEVTAQLASKRSEEKREIDNLTKKAEATAAKALQKLPAIERQTPESKFQTEPGSTQGAALRRADSYVESARRALNQATGSASEKAVAKSLVDKASLAIKQADKTYAAGQAKLGDAFLRVAYAMADASNLASPPKLLTSPQQQRVNSVNKLFDDAKALANSKKTKAAESTLKIAEKHLDVVNGKLVLAPASGFQWPLANSAGKGNITTHYGVIDRLHPRPHRGTDIGVPERTKVVASADGIVTQKGYDEGGFGNYVVVESTTSDGKTLQSILGHLSSGSVDTGDVVHSGDELGASGNTGSSSGPHLHIEVRNCTGIPACNAMVKPINGGPQPVNPEDYL